MGKGHILGDIHTPIPTKGYRDSWDRIFGKEKPPAEDKKPEEQVKENRRFSHF